MILIFIVLSLTKIKYCIMKQFELSKVLEFLKNTKEESWCVDVVKTKDGKNCLFGHIFDYGGSECFDWFENIATTYMVYPVNDGNNPRYKQDTPKKRCVAYVENLLNGSEMTTYQLMEEEYERTKKDSV